MPSDTPAPSTDTPTPAPTPTTPSDAPAPVAPNAPDGEAPVAAPASGDDDTSLVGGAKARDGDAAPAEGDAPADGEGDSAAVVPEAYELKVVTTDAEGKEVSVELDAALLAEATPLFKEAGLTNDAANKLAPLALKVQERMLQQIGDEHTARIADWAKAVKSDPELGGAKWPATETNIDRALSHFGAPSAPDADGNETNEFRALLNDSGLGNNPTLVRMFNNIGKALGEDSSLVRTDAVKLTKKSAEEIMYPAEATKK